MIGGRRNMVVIMVVVVMMMWMVQAMSLQFLHGVAAHLVIAVIFELLRGRGPLGLLAGREFEVLLVRMGQIASGEAGRGRCSVTVMNVVVTFVVGWGETVCPAHGPSTIPATKVEKSVL